MKYFRNTELAKIYNVSEKSVRNWIQAALEGKLELQLYESKDKHFISNTPKNTMLIEALVEKGKKFKNSRAIKVVSPTPDFYELCTPRQVYDLIASMDIYKEIPHQYSYLDGGAKHWDQYAQKLLSENTPNSVTNTIQLLRLNRDYIAALVENHSGFNVIDIGPGNCLPVRELLEFLLEEGLLSRYIAIDISNDMLKIAERNINKWFGDRVKFEGYVRDINYDRFEDLVIANSFSATRESAVNLVLFFGGTISNLRDPNQALRIISNSMGKDDIFMLSRKLDTEATRRYFDFTLESDDKNESNIKEKIMLNMLGIEESFYTIEHYFDRQIMARVMQAKLKVDLIIRFELQGNKREIEFHKGEGILLWRSNHQTLQDTINQLDSTGFEVLQASKSKDQQYSLFISNLKIVR